MKRVFLLTLFTECTIWSTHHPTFERFQDFCGKMPPESARRVLKFYKEEMNDARQAYIYSKRIVFLTAKAFFFI